MNLLVSFNSFTGRGTRASRVVCLQVSLGCLRWASCFQLGFVHGCGVPVCRYCVCPVGQRRYHGHLAHTKLEIKFLLLGNYSSRSFCSLHSERSQLAFSLRDWVTPPPDVRHKSSYQKSTEGYFQFVSHWIKIAEGILANYKFNTWDIYNIYKLCMCCRLN